MSSAFWTPGYGVASKSILKKPEPNTNKQLIPYPLEKDFWVNSREYLQAYRVVYNSWLNPYDKEEALKGARKFWLFAKKSRSVGKWVFEDIMSENSKPAGGGSGNRSGSDSRSPSRKKVSFRDSVEVIGEPGGRKKLSDGKGSGGKHKDGKKKKKKKK